MMYPPKLLPFFFLALTLAVPVALAEEKAAPRDDSAAEKLGWLLATKAYTFRSRTCEETIEISRSLGVKYFEVNPTQKMSAAHPVNTDQTLPPDLRAELKQKFAAAGITPVSFGVTKLNADEAYDRTVFEYAKSLGLSDIVSEPPPEAFPLLDRLTQEYGIKVAIHNHPKPSPYWQPESELKVFAGTSDRIGACADVGHWTRSDLSTIGCLRQLQGRIVQLHFKDVNAAKKDVPWGTGTSNVRGMLDELHRQNFRGVFSMEYEGESAEGLIDELRQSIVYFDREARRIAGETK